MPRKSSIRSNRTQNIAMDTTFTLSKTGHGFSSNTAYAQALRETSLRTGLPRGTIALVLSHFFEQTVNQVCSGNAVRVPHFGNFLLRAYPARKLGVKIILSPAQAVATHVSRFARNDPALHARHRVRTRIVGVDPKLRDSPYTMRKVMYEFREMLVQYDPEMEAVEGQKVKKPPGFRKSV